MEDTSVANMRARRTAVLLHQYPLCVLAVERVLSELGIDVAGKATELDEALALVEERDPAIFVAGIDGALDPGGRAQYIREAHRRASDLRLIALSIDGEQDHIDEALAAGAAAYVVETRADRDELEAAIRQAVEWLDAGVRRPVDG